MSKKTLEDLRDHLFNTLDSLVDKNNPMDIERAKAICEVAQTIVNTAKVEVAYLDSVGGTGTGFLSQPNTIRHLPSNS